MPKGVYPRTAYHGAQISAAMMGQPGRRHTPETKAKLRAALSAPLGSIRICSRGGYRYVKTEDGWRQEHRLVMGLTKGDGLIAHHDDEDKLNNHPDNLRVMTQSEHVAMHNRERRSA